MTIYPVPNKYVTHFNAVVSNYVETLLVPERKEFHATHAHYLDNLMREYAKATELLDQVRGGCWYRVERALNRGADYQRVAATLITRYPMLTQDIADFVEDLAAPQGET